MNWTNRSLANPAAAIVGGMSVSTLFRLIFPPSLLRFKMGFGGRASEPVYGGPDLTQHRPAE